MMDLIRTHDSAICESEIGAIFIGDNEIKIILKNSSGISFRVNIDDPSYALWIAYFNKIPTLRERLE